MFFDQVFGQVSRKGGMRILAIFLFSFGLMASTSWKSTLHENLPAPLSSFRPHQTTLKEVQALMGKADLVEKNSYYWEKDGLKYALQLTFNQKKILTSLHYTFTKNKLSLDTIKDQIDLKRFSPYPTEGKSAGRYLISKEKDVELTIDPISKTVRSVKLK